MKLDRIWTTIPIATAILLAGAGISYGLEKSDTAGGSRSTACGYVPNPSSVKESGKSLEYSVTESLTSLSIKVVSAQPGTPLPASTMLLIEGPGQPVCLPVNESGKIEDSGLWDPGTYRFSVGDRNSTTGSPFKLIITEQ